MPYHKSSEKRMRSDGKKRLRNRESMAATRTIVKNLESNLGELKGQPDKAKELLRAAQSKLAKAAASGRMKKNTVARKISRLAAMVRKATAGEFAPQATKTRSKPKK